MKENEGAEKWQMQDVIHMKRKKFYVFFNTFYFSYVCMLQKLPSRAVAPEKTKERRGNKASTSAVIKWQKMLMPLVFPLYD